MNDLLDKLMNLESSLNSALELISSELVLDDVVDYIDKVRESVSLLTDEYNSYDSTTPDSSVSKLFDETNPRKLSTTDKVLVESTITDLSHKLSLLEVNLHKLIDVLMEASRLEDLEGQEELIESMRLDSHDY